MKKAIRLLLLLLFALPCQAEDTRMHFKKNGFSIAPLEGKSDSTPYVVVMMFLPASEGFAPNVNVNIQPYTGTIKEYAALSRRQFAAAKYTVVREKLSPTSAVWEYSGEAQGRKLHWYAKAVRKEGKVYLVTATSTEAQWKTVSARLKACVDSLSVDKAEQNRSSERGKSDSKEPDKPRVEVGVEELED